MKKLILIIVLLLLAGCGDDSNELPKPEYDRLNKYWERYHDDEMNVTCWKYRSMGSISCIPDWMLEPPTSEHPYYFTRFNFGYVANVYQYIDDYRFEWFTTLEDGNSYRINLELEIGEYVALVCDPITDKCYVDYHQLEDSE